ncbi:hypothetical protein PUNSTDRAFT_43087 [Punctularia strigosozonata HHB-11173 SS5]|uniref:uncharacterized protein n=1 Tax=Punctularia strigosozonata (strain HHB-11173) TaxID=741275 RepID=UPI0004416AFF|nr:uncharacterized protein PUNSTDRAFT_43087 [Punctularia strigosozonata HHB-11173 SS5]EIN12017.1 hypothetical protein PUNSTDRAFT_43087 [Punctularia strigosozonata HHB-11173 SS5]
MNQETKIPKPPGFPGRDFSIRKAMRIGTTQQQNNMYNDFRARMRKAISTHLDTDKPFSLQERGNLMLVEAYIKKTDPTLLAKYEKAWVIDAIMKTVLANSSQRTRNRDRRTALQSDPKGTSSSTDTNDNPTAADSPSNSSPSPPQINRARKQISQAGLALCLM